MMQDRYQNVLSVHTCGTHRERCDTHWNTHSDRHRNKHAEVPDSTCFYMIPVDVKVRLTFCI